MDDLVAITLFRHGVTEANQRKAYLGWTDSPLTKEAMEQLRSYQLGNYDLYVSSDLGRCINTMKLIFPDETPLIVPEFREMNFGEFEGKTFDTLKDDHSYQKWIGENFINAPPGGESFTKFQLRVEQGFRKMVKHILFKEMKHVFVVTHGGVIRYLLDRFSTERKGFWNWQVKHGHGYVLTFKREELRRSGKCILLQEVPLMEKASG